MTVNDQERDDVQRLMELNTAAKAPEDMSILELIQNMERLIDEFPMPKPFPTTRKIYTVKPKDA